MTIIFGFGRQLETCTLREFRGINSKTQVQAPPAKRQPTPKYKKSYQNKNLHAIKTLKGELGWAKPLESTSSHSSLCVTDFTESSICPWIIR